MKCDQAEVGADGAFTNYDAFLPAGNMYHRPNAPRRLPNLSATSALLYLCLEDKNHHKPLSSTFVEHSPHAPVSLIQQCELHSLIASEHDRDITSKAITDSYRCKRLP